MIARTRTRGITLVEILISILLLGVGVTSIMTLFPLGLLNVRNAARLSRSAFLTESATADLGTRNLLSKASFQNSYSGFWYADVTGTYTPWPYDPWVQDTPSYLGDPILGPAFGAYRGEGSFNVNNKRNNVPTHNLAAPYGYIPGPGLPVAYDPLWRDTAGVYMGNADTEARFGSGIGFVRPDPQGGNPSAHGLQRLTNFPAGAPMSVPDIFVSPEDMVLQSETDQSQGAGAVSPIVPDLNLSTNPATNMATPQYDWKYTWMFTGRQADCTDGSIFDGDIVVFENRPFAVDQAATPFGGTMTVVTGETVVEAVFGATNNVTVGAASSAVGYGTTANRVVLLRWPASMPDPEIRVGSWIADVTYERNAATDRTRALVDPSDPAAIKGGVGPAGEFHPYQRCNWYQIAKRTQAEPGRAFTKDTVAYREMTVWTSTPLKDFTLLYNDKTGSPYHVNAALVSPYVVNVFHRTIYSR